MRWGKVGLLLSSVDFSHFVMANSVTVKEGQCKNMRSVSTITGVNMQKHTRQDLSLILRDS